jgi:hypothetical protein
MKKFPGPTVNILKNTIKRFDPAKMIGCILNIGEESREIATNFLEYCVDEL